jgi:hypothetical protein
MNKNSFGKQAVFSFVLALSLAPVLSCCGVLPQAFGQDKGGLKAKNEVDPYSDILNVIKNFFQRRYDADKTQCLTSISKDYKVIMLEGKILDYNRLKSGLEQRSLRMELLAVEDLRVTEFEAQDGSARAQVEFLQRVRTREGKVVQNKHLGEIFLKREIGWKITAIIDLHRLDTYDKEYIKSCFKTKE